MKSVIFVMVLMVSASGFAADSFTCSNNDASVKIHVDRGHNSGTLFVNNSEFDMFCTGGVRYGLTCKAYVGNSYYEAYVHNFLTRANVEIFAGHLTHIVGGIAGNESFNLGSFGCSYN